jgi:hypothetical protein
MVARAPRLPMEVRAQLVLDAALRVSLREGDALSMDAEAAEAGIDAAPGSHGRCYE